MKTTPRRVYNIVLCIAILVLGACFIAGCLNIYYTGAAREQVYTREIVRAELIKYAIPIIASSLIILGSFIIDFFDPMPEPLSKKVSCGFLIKGLSKRRDISSAKGEELLSIKRERKIRRIHTLITLVLCIISTAVFLFYALNPAHFHKSEINDSMIKAMLWLLPCLIVPFVYSIIAAILKEKSLKREMDIIKKLPAKTAEAKKQKINIPVLCIRIAILQVAVGFTVYGIAFDGTADVLTKAINICTECIGLG